MSSKLPHLSRILSRRKVAGANTVKMAKVVPTATQHVLLGQLPLPYGPEDIYRLGARANLSREAFKRIVFQRNPLTLQLTGSAYVEGSSREVGERLAKTVHQSLICGSRIWATLVGDCPIDGIKEIGGAAGRSVLLSGLPTWVTSHDIDALLSTYDVAEGTEPWLLAFRPNSGETGKRFIVKLTDQLEAERLVQQYHLWRWRAKGRGREGSHQGDTIISAELLH